MSPNLLAILPETILTLTGVLIMLAEPVLAPGRSRKPLGWLAILGPLGAGAAALYQHALFNTRGALLAFYSTVQVDEFSVFFHLLIAAIVLITLLGSLDYFDRLGPASAAPGSPGGLSHAGRGSSLPTSCPLASPRLSCSACWRCCAATTSTPRAHADCPRPGS